MELPMGSRSHCKKHGLSTSHDLGMDEESLRRSFLNHIEYSQAKDEFSCTEWDHYMAAALSVRDRILDRWNKTQQGYYERDAKRVYYLSLEFLIGRLLDDGLVNLGIRAPMAAALESVGLSLERIIDREWDAGLGNGGLGRLAACFLESMATLGVPAMGYGILYEYGIFRQLIVDGAQTEAVDDWRRYGCPWDVARPDVLFPVHYYGRVETETDENGRPFMRWVDTEDVMALAHDIFIPGHKNDVVNTLRLWSAKATRELDLSTFNRGDYVRAIHDKADTETLSRVLYPSDTVDLGKELRLKQEYFFVAATLHDAIRRHLKVNESVRNLADKAVFQLNDTHPAIAVPELMRILVDEHRMAWDEAWNVCRRCFAYTNHTVLPEALECWSTGLVGKVLPRHLQIIFEINQRFLDDVRRRYGDDSGRISRMSLIAEGEEKWVRMAHLAIVGSFSVNGVSELHTRILRERIFPDFAELMPEKFNNKTNGITPRRWLLECNPDLAALITSRIGDSWLRNLQDLEKLLPFSEDAALQRKWRDVKQTNKRRLAEWLVTHCGIEVDPTSLFDIQIKRLHEYKRQLLNILHVIALYHRYRQSPPTDPVGRTFLFAGKAAPAYTMAKLIIRLINGVADVVNGDPKTSGLLRVVFVPNYSVTVAEKMIPAADLSEQISTAGTEASGTGNMKLALNGALTLGTLDGANVEIKDAVGDQNFFLFGHTLEEATTLLQHGYDPRLVIERDAKLREVLDAVARGDFSPDEPGRFRPIVDSLLDGGDHYLVLADFDAYRTAQERVTETYRDPKAWTAMSIRNVAKLGRFSSDYTIAAYARDIWGVPLHKI